NNLLWSYFDVSPIPGKLWYPKRGEKQPLADNVIQCKFCSWKTTGSARASSTTNMRSHVNKSPGSGATIITAVESTKY
ncbi:hypothetical protein V1525DRAFT_321522, partial [Lipomyces kononenkoae]